jgi:hypothetical protein
VERGSDRHGPRVDDELEHEVRSLEQGAPVEARAEEAREQEGPGDDQPTPEGVLQGGRASAGSLSVDDADARAELARFLGRGAFPADRDGLLAAARAHHATDEVLGRLEALPAGRTFENVEAAWEALGGPTERRF